MRINMARKSNTDSDKAKTITEEVEETADVCKIETLPAVEEWCQTGCTILDVAIANQFPGGIPIGRIVQVYGGTSTSKSILACSILGYAQRSGKMCHYADVEHTLAPDFASLFGLNCGDEKTFAMGYPENLEDLFDNYIYNIIYPGARKRFDAEKMDRTPKIVVVDSITALPATIEMEKDMTNQGFGAYRAKQISLGLRRFIKPLSESNTTLICIDQTRDNLKSPWGGEITTGGRGLEFYSSVRLYLKHDGDVSNTAKKVLGIWVKFKTEKNKTAPPLRDGYFKIVFDYGLDDIASNLHFLCELQNNKTDARKVRSKIKIFGEEHTTDGWISKIESENLEANLRVEVWKAWQEIYKTEDRKPRTWD